MGFDRVLPSVIGVTDGVQTSFGWAAKRQPENKLEAVKRLFATEDSVRHRRPPGGASRKPRRCSFGHIRSASPGDQRRPRGGDHPGQQPRGRPVPHQALRRAGRHRGAGADQRADRRRHGLRHRRQPQTRTILVFDWGGGTLDVTVLETIEGVFIERASKGIPRSGGIDLDDGVRPGDRARCRHVRRGARPAAPSSAWRSSGPRSCCPPSHEANLTLPDGALLRGDPRAVRHGGHAASWTRSAGRSSSASPTCRSSPIASTSW